MERIVDDRYYDIAKKFIQEHIEMLPLDIALEFTNYYNKLTPENAKSTYNLLQSMYTEYCLNKQRNFDIHALKIGGFLAVVGTAGIIGAYLYDKYVKKSSVNNGWISTNDVKAISMLILTAGAITAGAIIPLKLNF